MGTIRPAVIEARGVWCGGRRAAGGKGGGEAGLRDVTLSVEEGSLAVLWGPEGSGRNLLLRVLGLLERPDRGEVYWDGEGTAGMGEEELAGVRSRDFGFVFAEPFLLPGLSAAENVAMPIFKVSGAGTDEARARTESLLDLVGVGSSPAVPVEALPFEEQHRVALARALANRPRVLFVEEAGRDLDAGAYGRFLSVLQLAKAECGLTAVLSTGRREALAGADAAWEVGDGRLVGSGVLSGGAGGGAA